MNIHAFLLPVFIICLLLISYQDIRYRSVPVYIFSVAFISALVIQYDRCGMDQLFVWQIICNSIFIVLNFLFVFLYVKKVKKIPLKDAIGLGDLVFYMVLIPFLNTPAFMYFHIVSLMLVLITYPMLKNKLSLINRSIPLAGLQACCLIFFLILFEYCIPEKSITGSCSIIYWI
jgi:hypothetical protein